MPADRQDFCSKGFRFFRVLVLAVFFFLPGSAYPEGAGFNLSDAVICKGIEKLAPVLPGVVFPDSLEKIYCFTHFSAVPKKTSVYHVWYSRDRLVAKIKLAVRPPQWSTYSTIQLRTADKGPWRVEITDEDGRTLKILRFSIAGQ